MSHLFVGGNVGLLIELAKEKVEHDCVHADPPDEGPGVVAVDEKKLEGVHHDSYELHLRSKSIQLVHVNKITVLYLALFARF